MLTGSYCLISNGNTPNAVYNSSDAKLLTVFVCSTLFGVLHFADGPFASGMPSFVQKLVLKKIT